MTTKERLIYLAVLATIFVMAFVKGWVWNLYTLWVAIWVAVAAIVLPVVYFYFFR